MARPLSAEIIASGTELLLGDTVDTNSAYIAQKLRDLGVDVYFHTTVGDNVRRLRSAIEIAASRANLIIITGGLGPTVDDVTREAVASAIGRPLVFSEELLEQIADRFARFGRTMSDNNRRQAFIPEGATPIPNPVGTAPAFRAELGEAVIIALPGVPREMHYLMEHAVIPYIRALVGAACIRSRVLHCAGLGESQVDALIGDLMEGTNPTVGLSAHPGRTDIRITAKADTPEHAEALIAPVQATISERLRGYVYGADEDRLATVVARLLRERGQTVHLVETVTAGLVAQELIEADASVVGEHVVREWSGDAEEAQALEAAQSIRPASDSAVVLASLAADPAPDAPEGRGRRAAVAVVSPEGTATAAFNFGSHPGLFQPWVANHSLFTLWRALQAG
ncbi:MAG: CinA family nicotinamide mononucleotide deamidase-related protein [Anaerolineae bacterium]|jgi:nicotinamide-nucleotide amidase